MFRLDTDGSSVTYASDRTGIPDLRLIHYNDVYHVEYDPSCLSPVAEYLEQDFANLPNV